MNDPELSEFFFSWQIICKTSNEIILVSFFKSDTDVLIESLEAPKFISQLTVIIGFNVHSSLH